MGHFRPHKGPAIERFRRRFRRYRSCICEVVDGGEVQNAVAIKIPGNNCNRQAADGVSFRCLKSSIAIAEEESDSAILAHREQIENTVVIEISAKDSAGEISSRIRHRRVELAIRLAQENRYRARTECGVCRGNIWETVAIESATTDCVGAPDALVTSALPKLWDAVFESSGAVPRSVFAVMSVKSTLFCGTANPKPLTVAVKS